MSEEQAKGSVRQMLQQDIDLKAELVVLKKGIDDKLNYTARRQLVVMILTSICTIAVITVFVFYFTRPTKVDVLVFQQIQKERAELKLEREASIRKNLFDSNRNNVDSDKNSVDSTKNTADKKRNDKQFKQQNP